MTDAARKQAIDELGRAVARVISLGIGSHPLAEALMGMLDSGAVTMRVTIDLRPEMALRVEAVPSATGAAPIEVLRVDAADGPKGPVN